MAHHLALVVALTIAGSSTPVEGRDVRVPDGTPVLVKLLQFISSETSRVGDPVRFGVAEDVTVERAVVIRRGAPAAGNVVDARPYQLPSWRWFWWYRVRRGRLAFTVTEAQLVTGEAVRLRTVADQLNTTRPIRMTEPLIRWHHEGETFKAFVDGDYVVVAAEPPPGEDRSER